LSDTFDRENSLQRRRPFKSWLKQAAEYKPCLKNFPGTLFSMVLTNIRQTWKLYCSDDRKMQVAYHHLSCMTPETKPALGMVYHKVTTLFESLMKLQEMSDFLPGICCGARHMISASRKDLAKICAAKTGPESADYFVNLVYTPMSDAVDLICSGFRALSDCEAKAAKVNAMIRKTLNEVKTYNHTAIIPMVSLLNRLDRELSAD
jgi:hypothetical protein